MLSSNRAKIWPELQIFFSYKLAHTTVTIRGFLNIFYRTDHYNTYRVGRLITEFATPTWGANMGLWTEGGEWILVYWYRSKWPRFSRVALCGVALGHFITWSDFGYIYVGFHICHVLFGHPFWIFWINQWTSSPYCDTFISNIAIYTHQQPSRPIRPSWQK